MSKCLTGHVMCKEAKMGRVYPFVSALKGIEYQQFSSVMWGLSQGWQSMDVIMLSGRTQDHI